MSNYASFVEDFRDNLTTRIRAYILANPLEPINDIRNALFDALGPQGAGYLSTKDDITVNVLGPGGTPLTFDIDDHTSKSYGLTPTGQEFEIVNPAATTITFGVQLVQGFSAAGLDHHRQRRPGPRPRGHQARTSTVDLSNGNAVTKRRQPAKILHVQLWLRDGYPDRLFHL